MIREVGLTAFDGGGGEGQGLENGVVEVELLAGDGYGSNT